MTPTAEAADRPEILTVTVGSESWPLKVRPGQRVAWSRADATPAAVTPAALVATALQSVVGMGAPLARALTPDDRVAIVLDEQLPHVGELLTAVVAHCVGAGVSAEAITVVLPPGGTGSAWLDELPDDYADIRIETHDLEDPKKLAYLGTTRKAEARVYLNRTLVEADAIVTLTSRRYDPTFAVRGAAAAIFPALADPESAARAVGHFSTDAPGDRPTSPQRAAREVALMLGNLIDVHVVEGVGDTVQSVIATLPQRSAAGEDALDGHWRLAVADTPDLVVLPLAGANLTFLDIARAAAVGARVVKPGGRVVVAAAVAPQLGEGAERVRQVEDPEQAKPILKMRKPDDWPAAALWLRALRETNVYLWTPYDPATVEELFAVPLASVTELERLIESAGRVLVVPDGHKAVLDLA